MKEYRGKKAYTDLEMETADGRAVISEEKG